MPLRGFATINYFADDIAAATDWYTELLGVEPYFQNPAAGGAGTNNTAGGAGTNDTAGPPAYVEFRIGDHHDELGLLDSRFAPHPRGSAPGGAITYWHVDDVPATVERLLAMGATVHDPITPRSSGFVTASVVDPFGNVLGVMHNPHYVEVIGKVGIV